jgi:hypothetical protein
MEVKGQDVSGSDMHWHDAGGLTLRNARERAGKEQSN